VDIIKQKVSLLEGEDIARKLGYVFLEALVKDSVNFKESLLYIIVR
jgi:hypothetical protein